MRRLLSRARRVGRFSARLAGYYAERLWFTPWPTPMSSAAAEREKRWLASTWQVRVPFEGRVLRGFTVGSGPTVLLVHGWGDHVARLGAFVEPLVAAGMHVIGVDLPAHGDGAVGMTNAYQMSRAVQAVGAALGGVDAIISHSMGVNASVLALRDGMPCRAIVAVAAPTMRFEDTFEKFGELLNLPPRTMVTVRRAIERRMGNGRWEGIADALGRKHGLPALVIHDVDDPLVPLRNAQALADSWGVPLTTTSGLGHHNILRDDTVVEPVVAFLADALNA
jgi:pimeloyl-ACP methyl ester carboxylesterase